nr:MAG TPA: hypothetical protein [Caudoviricetes sp.]
MILAILYVKYSTNLLKIKCLRVLQGVHPPPMGI